jgi:hypothetical protein
MPRPASVRNYADAGWRAYPAATGARACLRSVRALPAASAAWRIGFDEVMDIAAWMRPGDALAVGKDATLPATDVLESSPAGLGVYWNGEAPARMRSRPARASAQHRAEGDRIS